MVFEEVFTFATHNILSQMLQARKVHFITDDHYHTLLLIFNG